MSQNKMHQLMHLTELIPELQTLVNKGTLSKLGTAYELSCLKPEAQVKVYERYKSTGKLPSLDEAKEMRRPPVKPTLRPPAQDTPTVTSPAQDTPTATPPAHGAPSTIEEQDPPLVEDKDPDSAYNILIEGKTALGWFGRNLTPLQMKEKIIEICTHAVMREREGGKYEHKPIQNKIKPFPGKSR